MTMIIAEVGVNHNGSLDIAKQLIDICANAGVDIVKFQTFSAEKLVSKRAQKAEYQIQNDGSGSQLDMLKKLELSDADYREIKEYCDKKNVEFLSTAFDEEALEYLVNLGVKKIKIPSGELTNLPYLRYASSFRLPVLLSTGMASLNEVSASVEVLLESGLTKDLLTILHCTSSYPAEDENLNLNAMKTMRDKFGVQIGYSDHSQGIVASLVAASMGAEVIEKHITLDRNLRGPDHKASIEPNELDELVNLIRRKEVMAGSYQKQPTENELKVAKVARRSIVAFKKINKGDVLSLENICTKRPGTGLSPMIWDDIINTIAIKDFEIDEPIVLKESDFGDD